MAKKSSKSEPSVDQKLMDFVINVAVNNAARERFADPANREQMMEDAGLSEAAKTAIRNQNENAVERALNQQIVVIEASKKPAKPKAAKKTAAKKKAWKSGKKR